MTTLLVLAVLLGVATGTVTYAVRLEHRRTQGVRDAWIHTLTVFAGVTGTADPLRAAELARNAVTFYGTPRTRAQAAELLDVLFEAGARSQRPAPDPVTSPGVWPWSLIRPRD